MGLLGSSYKILGRTESCDFPPAVKESPVVMNGTKPNFELISKMSPDVILYDHDILSEADVAKLKQLGFATVDIGADTLDEYFEILQTYGANTRNEMAFSEYADRIHKIRQTKASTARKPPVKIAIVMPGKGGQHMICGTDGMLADCIKTIGGEPTGPKGKMFITLNPEAFIQLNPEAIITAGDPTPIVKDPRFANLKAVKNGKIWGINPDVLLRRGARFDKLLEAMGPATN